MASMEWDKVAANAATEGVQREIDEIEAHQAKIEQLAAESIREVVSRKVRDAERAKRRVQAGIIDDQPVVPTPAPTLDQTPPAVTPTSVEEATAARVAAQQAYFDATKVESRALIDQAVAGSSARASANATATATAPVVVPAGSSWYRKVTTKGNTGLAIVVGLLAAFAAWVLWILVDDYAVGEGGWFSSPLVTLLIVLLVGIGAGLIAYNGESKVTETTSTTAPPAAAVPVQVTQQPAEAAASATAAAPQA